MLGIVMLAGIIASIGDAFCPKETEESLRFATLQPLKTHVVGFGCLGGH